MSEYIESTSEGISDIVDILERININLEKLVKAISK